jgi:hypothetical protein
MNEQTNENEMKQVELSLKHAKELAEAKVAIGRLTKNRDFKRIFTEGYFEKEAIRLVLLKGDPSWQGDTEQASIIAGIDAIGTLRQFLQSIYNLGTMAQKTIEDDQETLDELRAES